MIETPHDQLLVLLSNMEIGDEDFTSWTSIRDLTTKKSTPNTKFSNNSIFLNILISLDYFEQSFQNVFSPNCQIYLLGYDSLVTLMGDEKLKKDDVELNIAIDMLHSIGLIYRLPCAVKFGYPAVEIPQIRISAWGRKSVSQLAGEGSIAEDNRLNGLSKILSDNKNLYIELIEKCSSPKRPLNTATIHQLNKQLPLKIVT